MLRERIAPVAFGELGPISLKWNQLKRQLGVLPFPQGTGGLRCCKNFRRYCNHIGDV